MIDSNSICSSLVMLVALGTPVRKTLNGITTVSFPSVGELIGDNVEFSASSETNTVGAWVGTCCPGNALNGGSGSA